MYRAAEALIDAGLPTSTSRAPRRCAPTAATSTRPAPTARSATARRPRTWRAFARCATASMPTARWCCARRSTWPARTSTCATRRSTASSAPRTTTPATAGASTRCTPTRTRSRTRWRTSPTASARWSSRTSARSTTGCWSAWPKCGLLAQPLPKQYEFARLNLTYVVTSKRKLRQLVDEGIVDGWDDPRMPTLVGMRRRGYTPESLRAAGRAHRRQQDQHLDRLRVLDIALRDDLEGKAPRAMAVLDPLKLKLTNWDRGLRQRPDADPAARRRTRSSPNCGMRQFGLGPEVWIERDDFVEVPPKGFFRLFPPRFDGKGRLPGNKVRLKYGLVVECTGCRRTPTAASPRCWPRWCPTRKSGTPGADAVKVKGTLTWVGVRTTRCRPRCACTTACSPKPSPTPAARDFLSCLNPRQQAGRARPGRALAGRGRRRQLPVRAPRLLRRRPRSTMRPAKPVFNRITGLKDGWAK